MKKIGIVGGIGPESTLDYYRGIIDGFRERIGGMHLPRYHRLQRGPDRTSPDPGGKGPGWASGVASGKD